MQHLAFSFRFQLMASEKGISLRYTDYADVLKNDLILHNISALSI